MQTTDYIRRFYDTSHIEVGDGLISVHTRDKSEVRNYDGRPLLELSADEYCINAKNGYFLVCNAKTGKYQVFNKDRETVATLETDRLFIPQFRNILVYRDRGQDTVCVADYAGRTLFNWTGGAASSLTDAYQLSHDVVCLETVPAFEERELNQEHRTKCTVINVPNREVILQGTCEEGYDTTVITDVSRFELPLILPNANDCAWRQYDSTRQNPKRLIPVIKYTVVEPCPDEDGRTVCKRHVEFCDFCGNVVKRTGFSEIAGKKDGFYIVKQDGTNGHDALYGVLDGLFNPLLPCRFPKLVIEEGTLKIEEPSWSDWASKELDLPSKRFLARRKDGTSILLPYLYSSCGEYVPDTDNNLLFAYRYDEQGAYCKGIINAAGEERLAAEYIQIIQIHEHLYEAVDLRQDSSLLYVDKDKVILRGKYGKIEPDGWDGYCKVYVYNEDSRTHVRQGIVDRTGQEIAPPAYDFVFFPREEKVTYMRNGLAGWINLADMSTHEYPRYSVIKPFVNGLSIVSMGKATVCPASDDIRGDVYIQFGHTNRREGMMDTSGRMVIEPVYEQILRIEDIDTMLIVKQSGKWGAIDNQGNVIIPLQYQWHSTDMNEDYQEYEDAACKFGDEEHIDFYSPDGELLGTEDAKAYHKRHRDVYGYDDQDYERDTFYALGGDDYDEWRNNGGNLDDMMDGMGL